MRRPLFWAALCLVAALALRLGTGGFDRKSQNDILRRLDAGVRLTVTGQVYQKDGQTIYLQDVSVCSQVSEGFSHSQAGDPRQMISSKENLKCDVETAESIPLGSVCTLEGTFAPFFEATNPGEFDGAAYYRSLKIGGRLKEGSLLACGEKNWPLREFLYRLGERLKERLYHALPEKEAGVLCALLLGKREGLEESVETLYRRNGMIHILSISGLHVAIVGMSLYRLLRRLGAPLWAAAGGGSVLLLLYGGLTGFGISACRAIGMYLIRMLGQLLGRTYDMLTALALTGALMALGNPYLLRHSGFLLSFSAVLGMGLGAPLLGGKREAGRDKESGKDGEAGRGGEAGRDRESGRWSGRKKLWRKFAAGLGESARASLAVTLATLPVQLWFFYEAPVYALFLNLLILPWVKPLMGFGCLAMLWPGVSCFSLGAGLILKGYEALCRLFGSLPFSLWNPGRPVGWQIFGYYLTLGVAALLWKLAAAKRLRMGAVLCLAGALCLLGLHPGTGNRAVFLDVGQGDCILIQTDSGETYLFDCGSSSRNAVGENVLLPFLKYSGVRRLDGVFVSHPDTDHMNGVLELLALGEENGIAICQIVLPDVEEGLFREQFGQVLEAAGAAGGIPVRALAAGEAWECENARFTCLHPEKGWGLSDTNTCSECFYVEFFAKDGEKSTLLLTGDVEGEGERALLSQLKGRGIEQVDVLKAAHHGSRGSTSQELISQIRPRIAVISCGRENRYGHPHRELLERLAQAGCQVFRTDEQGALILQFTP